MPRRWRAPGASTAIATRWRAPTACSRRRRPRGAARTSDRVHSRTIEKATDELQLLEATRTNRQKRAAQGRFVVEGVRNIDAALANKWPVHAVLSPLGARLSSWATGVVDRAGVEHVGVAPDLFDRLTDR